MVEAGKKQLLLLDLMSPDYLTLTVPVDQVSTSISLSCDDPALFISPNTLEFLSTVATVEIRLLSNPRSSQLSLQIHSNSGQDLSLPVYFAQFPGSKLYSAGANDSSQLGFQDDSVSSDIPLPVIKRSSVPVEINYKARYGQISAGEKHAIATTIEGKAVSWGSNEFGQLGIEGPFSSIPKEIQGVERVWQVACGQTHTVILTYEGKVLTCGNGGEGRLGHGNTETVSRPVTVKSLLQKRITKVAAGYTTSFFLDIEGKLFSCGSASSGSLGHSHSLTEPTEITTLPPIHQISSGKAHTGCVDFDGNVHLFGDPSEGRLASSTPTSLLTPTDLGNARARAVYCGGAHTHILTETLEVYSFGCNKKGQLGLTRSDFQ